MPSPELPSAPEPLEELGVPAALEGERVDRAVASLTGWSRADVAQLLAAGAITVDGRAAPKSHRLRAGEVIALLAAPATVPRPGPEAVPVDIRHADPDLIVVAKAAGMVVHPGAGHAHGTLVQGLLAEFPELAGVGDPHRPGIVHRLDRDTSGLLAVARTPRAYDALVSALARHEVARGYLALVRGEPSSARGVIDAPIGRSMRRRTRMTVREAGRAARTAYTSIAVARGANATLLECRLETGRTHQIRVHLSAIGHPVIGDTVYGQHRAELQCPRPFLHAYRLAFVHPVTGARVVWTEPLPPDLAEVARVLDLEDGVAVVTGAAEPGP